MKFLIDTNIFIKAEPTSHEELEPLCDQVAELLRKIQESHNEIVIHPLSLADINQDSNSERKAARNLLFRKYPQLPTTPKPTPELLELFNNPAEGTNDYIDLMLLTALSSDAVHYLVSEDRKLLKKATRVGYEDSTLSISEALDLVQTLFHRDPPLAPFVTNMPAYEINDKDSIFESLRADYCGFDTWLKTCKTEHRKTWVLRVGNEYAGISIIKQEDGLEINRPGKTLKICTFKISDKYQGYKRGELLLKTIFDYCYENTYDQAYLTVYPRHSGLINLLEDFGFNSIGERNGSDEIVMLKSFRYSKDEYQRLSALTFNIKYGPKAIKCDKVKCFIMPIKPYFHRLLFPEQDAQPDIFLSSTAYGNSIKKAYLSNTKTNLLDPGSVIVLYRSKDFKAAVCVGVVESTFKSNDPDTLASYVGKRTVYSYNEIKAMCPKGTLAILFRHAFKIDKPIPLNILKSNGVLNGPPQSIVQIDRGKIPCLRKLIGI